MAAGIILFGLIGLAIYLIPGYTAYVRGHRQQTAIWVLNIFGGWTVIGWIIALVWAVKEED